MAETMNKYESFAVIKVGLGEEGVTAVVDKFKALIEQNGTLESVDEWGKRKLAYPIQDETEGVYFLFNFSSKADFPAELDRVYRITDGVLRHLIVKKED